MPNSFADGANARALPSTARQQRPRMLIVGPASLTLGEAQVLKEAAADLGSSVSLYRTIDDFRLADVIDELKDKARPVSHLLLVLGQLNSFDDAILSAAEKLDVQSVTLFCLHSSDSLIRHTRKVDEGKVQCIIVRTPSEENRVRARWHRIPLVVAEDIPSFAEQLVRTALDSIRSPQVAMAK